METKHLVKHDRTICKIITGSIRGHIKEHGNVTPDDIGTLTTSIVANLEGRANSAVLEQMKANLDNSKYVIVERQKYEKNMQRDLIKQNQYLVRRLKELDPKFNKKET